MGYVTGEAKELPLRPVFDRQSSSNSTAPRSPRTAACSLTASWMTALALSPRRLHRNQPDRPNGRVVKFYNGRGTAEQWIKEGKNALRWTRLSCHAIRHNAVRLQLHALAYNLANFLRTLALPKEVEQWSLTTLREKLVKIGARIVRHGRYVVFQLAEVAVPRSLFADILRRINGLRLRSPPLPA